jgi:hypothetical protein
MSGEFRGPRRFNHVGLSVPADLLDEDGRRDLCSFYGDVFGWDELPTMTLDRQRLVLSVGAFDQFVFLIADPDPMRCQRMDHVGLAVETRAEFEEMVRRLRAAAAADPRIDFIDHDVEDHGMLKLHNVYARFLLPLMVEVQWFEVNPA